MSLTEPSTVKCEVSHHIGAIQIFWSYKDSDISSQATEKTTPLEYEVRVYYQMYYLSLLKILQNT